MNNTLNKKCSVCNSSFECNASSDCWCMELDKLQKDEIDDCECLCKNCLLNKINRRPS